MIKGADAGPRYIWIRSPFSQTPSHKRTASPLSCPADGSTWTGQVNDPDPGERHSHAACELSSKPKEEVGFDLMHLMDRRLVLIQRNTSAYMLHLFSSQMCANPFSPRPDTKRLHPNPKGFRLRLRKLRELIIYEGLKTIYIAVILIG